MDTIPYPLRLRLSEDVPADGQLRVMRRIPQFDGPEVCHNALAARAASDVIRVAVFNVEHGYRISEIADFLETCPALRDADVLFGNEFDDGTKRSGNIDVSKALADRLGYQYAYALEFIELVDPNDKKGYEGNTLFSRWPIVRAESLYLPEGYNWYFDEQKRIGERVAVFCELDVNGRHVGAVSLHLENRTSPEKRAAQIQAILSRADELFHELPVVIGGDFNTNGFDYSPEAAEALYAQQKKDGVVRDAAMHEPLFSAMEQAGFLYRPFNGEGVATRRRPTGGGHLNLQLDWIAARNAQCVQHGCVSTLLSDGTTRPFDQLSDHNAVWADVRL